MPEISYNSPKLSLAFAKITAMPTTDSWSQVYVAGNLFAALSLRLTDPQNPELILSAVGKDIFNNLEAEFFSLTDKNMSTILTALEKTLSEVPEQIEADACFAFFKSDILYVFIVGKGKIQIKRSGKLATILQKTEKSTSVTSASGFLQTGDLILIQTDSFAKNTSREDLDKALSLELPNDIAESLTPGIDEAGDGTQAAIIISYTGQPQSPKILREAPKESDPSSLEEIEPVEKDAPKKQISDNFILPPKPQKPDYLLFIKKLKLPLPRLTLIQKISLIASLLIIIALITVITLSRTNQDQQKTLAMYNDINLQAQKLYDQGMSLKKLNNELAIEDFKKAQSLIKQNITKFPESSKERDQLNRLLNSVESQLQESPVKSTKIPSEEIELEKSHIFNQIAAKKAVAYFQDEAFNYMLTADSVISINKKSLAEKKIIDEKGTWDKPVSLSVYSGNIYILDSEQIVLKFVPSGTDYAPSNYFKEDAPVISTPVDFTIDSSVWILGQDGTIYKFVRGAREDFTVKGLPSAIGSRSKIYTTIDMDNLYILDTNSARIIKISKDGQFISQFASDPLAKAAAFEIIDNEQKAIFLSGSKTYSIPLISP